MTTRDVTHTHRAGELAYYDSIMAGLVPVKVESVIAHEPDAFEVVMRVTGRHRPGYPHGSRFSTWSPFRVVPRSHVTGYDTPAMMIVGTWTWTPNQTEEYTP